MKTMVKNINMKIYGPMSQILETLNVHMLKDSSVYTEKYYFSPLSCKDSIRSSYTLSRVHTAVTDHKYKGDGRDVEKSLDVCACVCASAMYCILSVSNNTSIKKTQEKTKAITITKCHLLEKTTTKDLEQKPLE